MTDSQKAWEERVAQARDRMGYVKGTSAIVLEPAILAKDAECRALAERSAKAEEEAK